MPVMRASLKNWLASDAHKIYIYTDKCIDKQLEVKGHVTIDFRFEPTDDFGTNCARKVLSLEHFIQNDPYTDVLFLDADCRIVGKVDHMFDTAFDIGVTVYPEVDRKHQLNNVSAGALFLTPSQDASDFVSEWAKEQKQTNGPCRDQASLSKVAKRMDSSSSTNIARFDCDIHNHHPRTGNPAEVAQFLDTIDQYGTHMNIIHLAHGTWKNDAIVYDVEKALGRSVSG